MANKRPRSLTDIGTPADADQIPIDDAGEATSVEVKHVTAGNLLDAYNSRTATLTNKTIKLNDNTFTNVAHRASLLNTKLIHTDGFLTNIHNLQGSSVVTYNGNQYIGYYNSSNQIVLEKWSNTTGIRSERNVLTGKTVTSGSGSDNHDHIAIDLDSTGIVHVAYGMHGDSLQYFKMPTSESVAGAAGSNISMVGTNETEVTYPMFFRNSSDKLYFVFRDGTESNSDWYMYEYDTGTSSWSAATGTGTAGIFVNGKTGADGSYVSRPHLESDGDFTFEIVWRTASGAANYADPTWLTYTGTAFEQVDGTSQTIPVTLANADKIVAKAAGTQVASQLQKTATFVDSAGNKHAIVMYEDSNSVQQVWHYKYVSSWTATQITRNPVNPASTNITAPLLVDSDENLYVFVVDYSGHTLWVYESNSLAPSYNEPYMISDPIYQRNSFNIDWYKWASDNVFNRMIQYIVDEVNNGSPTAVGIQRGVYLEQWDPSEGKTKTLSHSNLYSDDDINIRSENGRIWIKPSEGEDVWIKIDNQSFLQLQDIAGDGAMQIGNEAGVAGEFQPLVQGYAKGSNRVFHLTSRIDPADDVAGHTRGVFYVEGKRTDDTALQNAPVASFYNRTTLISQLENSGNWDFQGNSLLNASIAASLIDSGTLTHERGGLEADVSAFDGFVRISGGSTTEIKSNFSASGAPTVNDDSGSGYTVGSRWIDTTADKEYICLDATATAAVWTETTAGAGGGGDLTLDKTETNPINQSPWVVTTNITNANSYKMVFFVELDSVASLQIRFNNDSTTDYDWSWRSNGGGATTATGDTQADISPSAGASFITGTITIFNNGFINSHDNISYTGTIQQYSETGTTINNTVRIGGNLEGNGATLSRIDLLASAGNIVAGSRVQIFRHSDS